MERIGRVFERLTVLERVADRKYLCLCSCGNKTVVRWESLKRGGTKSCGCLRGVVKPAEKRAHTEVGVNKHPLYFVWRGMLKRCYDKNHVSFVRYGGRGVSVCEAWRTDFFSFANHVGARPEGTTLDRINNDGNYEPGNVRWASPLEQVANSSFGKAVRIDGTLMTRRDAETVLGLSTEAVRRAGKSVPTVEDALALAWLRKRAMERQRPGAQVNWAALSKLIPAVKVRLKISKA